MRAKRLDILVVARRQVEERRQLLQVEVLRFLDRDADELDVAAGEFAGRCGALSGESGSSL